MLSVVCTFHCFAEFSAAPVEDEGIETYTQDLGNGLVVSSSICINTGMGRSATGSYKANDYYSNGSLIGTIYLYGSFYYNGSTATATGASGAHAVASG